MARGRRPHLRGRRYVCSPALVRHHRSEPVPVPRPYGRVKAKPPSAVRFAALTQPTGRGLSPGGDEGIAFIALMTLSLLQRRGARGWPDFTLRL